MSIIANTTVISNFASIDQMNLLQQLFRVVYISTEVHREIVEGLDEGYLFYEPVIRLLNPFDGNCWLRLTSVAGEEELRILNRLPVVLHPGEASSIAIAQARGWRFLSDDLAARNYATRTGISFSGSIGCLVLAVERGLCTLEYGNSLLEQMIRQGFRSPLNDLTALID